MFSSLEKNSKDLSSPKVQDKFPEKLKEKKIEEDCFECKVVGAGASFAIAGYMAYLRMNVPHNDKSRRLFLTIFGAGKLLMFPIQSCSKIECMFLKLLLVWASID